MNLNEFLEAMEKFDAMIGRCKKCNHHLNCEMHKIVKYIEEIGKTQFLAELKAQGIDEIIKNLNVER